MILCIFIIIVYLVKNAATLACKYYQNAYAAAFQREVATSILASVLKRKYEYFVNTNSTLISQHIHGDTFATYNVLLNMFEFLAEVLSVTLIGIYLIFTDWLVATAALCLAFGSFLVIIIAFKKKLKVAGKRMTIVAAEQTKASYQAIYGIKEISVKNRRDYFVDKFENASRDVERITVLNNFLAACPDRILEGICIGGFIGIACVRIVLGSEPTTFIPVLGAFAMGAFKILPSISKMSTRINNIIFNQSRLANCYNNLEEVRQLEDEQRGISIDGFNSYDKVITFSNKIVIKDVNWKYQASEHWVLKGLNLEIKKGEAVALIGISGAGKTTLADVILGLLHPQKGQVLMDGHDIKTIPNSWCRNIGYVPQAVYLTDDSIRANVAFGIPNENVNDAQVWEALEQAQLSDYIKCLPNGLDTIVGERGLKLSGGQRQRIAIARALYDNPEILILDEATAALDTETETAVMNSIDSLLGRKTLVIIAHRLTTIRNCDRVYEIVNGKAVERNKDEVISNDQIR